MTDQADRALVEAIKRREARLLCRTCGHRVEADTGYCNTCGRMNSAKPQTDTGDAASGVRAEEGRDV